MGSACFTIPPQMDQVQRNNVRDLLYQNEDFRKAQAQKYLKFFKSTEQLSAEERVLIPRLCYREIRQVQAWNGLTKVGEWLFKISDPIFSKIPNDTKSTLMICGGSICLLGCLMVSIYTQTDKVIGSALLEFLSRVGQKVHLKI